MSNDLDFHATLLPPLEFEDDDFIFQYIDDDFDDPNLYLPNYFITMIHEEDIPMYEAAIAEFNQPDRQLEIDKSGSWGRGGLPALLCFSRGDLSEFWKIMDRMRGQPRPDVEAV